MTRRRLTRWLPRFVLGLAAFLMLTAETCSEERKACYRRITVECSDCRRNCREEHRGQREMTSTCVSSCDVVFEADRQTCDKL